MKCASFRWIDPEWGIRTLKVLEKLMEMKRKVGEEVRSLKEACITAKEEANVKVVELKTMTRYYREVTHNLFETRKKMRDDALLSPTEKGEERMWKKECAKTNMEIQETVSELQTDK
jgi:hypothetical protein